MATDFIFQIQKGEAVERYSYIEPADFYEDSQISMWSDYLYDEEEVADLSTFKELSNVLKADRFKEVVEIDSKKETITLHPGFKEVWFAWKFEEFKRLATESSIEDFISPKFEYQVRRSLGVTFDSFIYDEDNGYPEQIDKYFRSLPLDHPVTFYCGGLVAFHY